MVIEGFEELSFIMTLFSKSNKEDGVTGMRMALLVSHPLGVVIALALLLALYHPTDTHHPPSGRFSSLLPISSMGTKGACVQALGVRNIG